MCNRFILAATTTLVLSLAACGEARPVVGGRGGGTAGCTICHGTADRLANLPGTDPKLAAAPPLGVRGETDPARPAVGAHQAHVNPPAIGALRGPLGCNECHNPVPTDFLHAGNPPSQVVVFGTLARTPPASPTWDGVTGAAPTCSTTYCHGAFSFDDGQTGGSTNGKVVGNSFKPDWTQGAPQAQCGTCHDLPPIGHKVLSANLGPPFSPQVCSGCHPSTVLPNGQINASAMNSPGTHINGQIDEGAHADPNWCVLSGTFGQSAGCAPESAANPKGGRHALAALDFTPPSTGLQGCLRCHSVGGIDYGSADGESTSSCNDCHADTGTSNWLTNCTFCHGTAGRVANLPGADTYLAAAPPRGVQGETDPAQPAVGAHQAHVNPTDATALARPFSCDQCHNPMPPGAPHPSGSNSVVVFAGIATAGGARPSYDAATGCAATYCHGNYPPGGNNFTPSWTGGGSQVSCGTCHDLPPATGRVVTVGGGPPMRLHVLHSQVGLSCANCHAGYGFENGPVNLSLHVNGVVDVGVGVTQWNPATGACVGCHGSDVWW